MKASKHSHLLTTALFTLAALCAAKNAMAAGNKLPVVVEKTTYAGHSAYRISDGRTEAVIVPDLGGRVMTYGFVGGANWLWNSALTTARKPVVHNGEWLNWGGDKTWPGPQSNWKLLSGRTWPPDGAWDGAVHKSQVFPGGSLRTESPVSAHSGAKAIRTFSFNANGEFVIEQRVQKVKGDPLAISIWGVTQIVAPDAVFLPATPDSLYRDGFLRLSNEVPAGAVKPLNPMLLKVVPSEAANFKIGTDAPTAALAAVRGDAALVLKTTYAVGATYPDGPGVAVELFNCKEPQAKYIELELLSPLRPYYINTAYSQTIHWSLHQLPSTDVNSADNLAVVQQLIESK